MLFELGAALGHKWVLEGLVKGEYEKGRRRAGAKKGYGAKSRFLLLHLTLHPATAPENKHGIHWLCLNLLMASS